MWKITSLSMKHRVLNLWIFTRLFSIQRDVGAAGPERHVLSGHFQKYERNGQVTLAITRSKGARPYIMSKIAFYSVVCASW